MSPLGCLAAPRCTPCAEPPTNLGKGPWRDLEPLRGDVERAFLRPLYLGESVAPFRVLSPIRSCERRYEMPTERMAALTKVDPTRETRGVLRWMQAYRELRLFKRTTHTTGTRSIATGRSTKPACLNGARL